MSPLAFITGDRSEIAAECERILEADRINRNLWRPCFLEFIFKSGKKMPITRPHWVWLADYSISKPSHLCSSIMTSDKEHYEPLPEENESFLHGDEAIASQKPRPKRRTWLLFAVGYFVVMVAHVSIFCYQVRQSILPKVFKLHYSSSFIISRILYQSVLIGLVSSVCRWRLATGAHAAKWPHA